MFKLSDSTLRLWKRLLTVVTTADLLFVRTKMYPQSVQRIQRFLGADIIAKKRVSFSRSVPAQDHLLLYNQVDIVLDVQPWTGHITACEALLMGVPVVTLYGKTHRGRMVASILHAIGRSEWVAQSEEEYVAIVQRLASQKIDNAFRRALRNDFLRSTVCDGAKYTRSVEAMIEEYLAKRIHSPN